MTHPHIEKLITKFAAKWNLSAEQAQQVTEKFGLYHFPIERPDGTTMVVSDDSASASRWGEVSDRQLLQMLGSVADAEGIHSFCNAK